ncbi:hypothetical protein [Cyclobacterium salsum]|uniref:hypothetical protein n=1 Tax=Cyclobacterium salsum TaxID=2666329 RepID=UPI001391B8E5|nr:hypothetical protein [Cyclobacterium salsum]
MKECHRYFLPILVLFLLSSCGDLRKKAEDRLNDLQNKAASLDSLVNKEIDKVLTLDSIVNREGEKVKKLDSLLNRASSKMDSISSEKLRLLEKIIQ